MTDNDRLERIEDKLDVLDSKLTELRVVVEHRVTKLETKAGIFGALGGIFASILTRFMGLK
jgi:hypothetical protein